MDPMAIATSVGLILDEEHRTKQRPTRRPSSPIFATACFFAALLAAALMLAGCAAQSQSPQSSAGPNMTPIYQSPYGPTVYRVEGEDGPEIITVVPGHTPPRGGPRTYHIIQQP